MNRKVEYKLQASVGSNMEQNAMLGQYVENKQTCQVCREDCVMERDENYLLGEPVNND